MTVIIPAVLGLAVLAWVLWPVFKKDAVAGTAAAAAADELLEREEILLAERLDVEYDYQMGKLTYDEYRRLTELWEEEIRNLGAGEWGIGFLHRLEQELQEKMRDLENSRTPDQPGQKEATEVERAVDTSSSGTR
jgi:hypothetical protein